MGEKNSKSEVLPCHVSTVRRKTSEILWKYDAFLSFLPQAPTTCCDSNKRAENNARENKLPFKVFH